MKIIKQLLRIFPLRIRAWFDIQLGPDDAKADSDDDRRHPPTEPRGNGPRW